jgi:hypothetical protein
MKSKQTALITIGIFSLVLLGGAMNTRQQLKTDRSKIPDKVEASRGFQRWITNLKNKDIEINADELRLVEENEIYNTKWMKVTSIDSKGARADYDKNLESHREIPKIIFSPSDREYIDYRNENRDGFGPTEVHFYGLKDDKIIDARILDCSKRANCYFDRAYFLDNDVFVISEFSRNIHKHDDTTPLCAPEKICTYTIKLHVVDLKNNSRLVYESHILDLILADVIPEL